MNNVDRYAAYRTRGRDPRNRPSGRRRFRPTADVLERREVPATIYVEPLSYPHPDPSHFTTLQNALKAASPGDMVVIEPGATVKGIISGTTSLAQSANVGDTTINTFGPTAPGQFVTIDSERDLVVDVKPGPNGTFTETLNVSLRSSHGSLATVTPDITSIGINKPVMIMGELDVPQYPIPSNLSLIATTGAGTGTVIQHLQVSSLSLADGSRGVLVTDCVIGSASVTNSGQNSIEGNTINGTLGFNGSNGLLSGDLVSFNTFLDSAQGGAPTTQSLSVLDDNHLSVTDNTFSLPSFFDSAIMVSSSSGVQIARNTINAANGQPFGDGTDLGQISVIGPAPGLMLSANNVNTNGLGTAIEIRIPSPSAASSTSVRIEANSLGNNRVGIDVYGSGTGPGAAGTIDAGGGPLGSYGANDFRGMKGSTSNGVFAIRLSLGPGVMSSSTNNGAISALGNIYDDPKLANPLLIVKDGRSNTFTGGPLVGQGTINVGAVQLTKDQEFIEAVYKTFVDRAASPSEVQMQLVHLAHESRQAFANGIAHADESYQRQIDLTYAEYLHRAPDPGGRAHFLGLLQTTPSLALEQFYAAILNSDEYFFRAQALYPSTDANGAFIRALFNDEYRRTPSPIEATSYEFMLITTPANQAAAHQAVANTIVESQEALGDRIQDYYHVILNRNFITSADQIQGWLNTGLDLLSIQVAMAGTDEFYRDA